MERIRRIVEEIGNRMKNKVGRNLFLKAEEKEREKKEVQLAAKVGSYCRPVRNPRSHSGRNKNWEELTSKPVEKNQPKGTRFFIVVIVVVIEFASSFFFFFFLRHCKYIYIYTSYRYL